MNTIKMYRLALLLWCSFCLLQMAQGQCITGQVEVCSGGQHNYVINPADIPPNTQNTIWSVINGSLFPPTDQDETGVTWGTVGTTGVLSATFVNSNGNTLGVCSLAVNIHPTPSVTMQPLFVQECSRKGQDGTFSGYCENQIVNFSASGAGNCVDCYKWIVSGNAVLLSDKGQIQFTEPGNAEVCVIATFDEGCSAQLCESYVVYANPTANFTILSHLNATQTVEVCLNESLTFQGEYTDPNGFDAEAYLWKAYEASNPNNIIGGGVGASFTQKFKTAGNYIVELTVKNCLGCSDTKSVTVVVNEHEGPEIECPSVVCQGGNPVPYCSVNECQDAMWSVVGGSFVQSPDNPNCILVDWSQPLPNGMGTVSLSCANSLCPLPTTIEVPVIPSSPMIQGPTLICNNDANLITYNLPYWPGTTYSWSVQGNGVSGSWNPAIPNVFNVSLNNASGSFTVNVSLNNVIANCNPTPTSSLEVTVMAYSIVVESEDQHFCHNWSNGKSPSLTVSPSPQNDYQIEWHIRNNSFERTIVGGINNPTLNNLDFQNDFGGNSGSFIVTAYIILNGNTQTCDGLVTEIVIDDIVPPITSVTGKINICPGSTTSYQALPAVSGSTYHWDVTRGTIMNNPSNQKIDIKWNLVGPYGITVTRKIGDCLSDQYVLDINPISVPGSLMINPAGGTYCTDVAYTYTASETNLDTYTWTAYGGSIISGQGTPEVQVIWHISNNSPTLSLNGTICNKNLNANMAITLGGGSASITGPDQVCQNASAEYAVQNAGLDASYTWFLDNVPLGSTTPNITVDFPVAGQYVLKVQIKGFGGCPGVITAEYPVTVIPNPEPFVTQVGALCCEIGGKVVLTATVPVGSIINENITWLHEENGSYVNVNSSFFTGTYFVSGPVLTIIYDPAQAGMLGNFRIVYDNGNGCTTSFDHTVTCEENCEGNTCQEVDFTDWSFPEGGACGMVNVQGQLAQDCLESTYFQVITGLAGVGFDNPVKVSNDDPTALLGPFTQPGAYQVALVGVYDCDGPGPSPTTICADSRYIMIPAISNFEANILCPTPIDDNIYASLLNTTSILPPYDQASAIAWEWTANGSVFSTSQTAVYPLTPGQATTICLGLSVMVKDDLDPSITKPYSCSFCRDVVVPAELTPEISVAQNSNCAGAVGTFSVTGVSPDEIVSYYWTFYNESAPFGNYYYSSVTEPTFSFPNAGNYMITLEIEQLNGCTITVEREITIDPLPFATIVVNPSSCGTKLLSACSGDCSGLGFLWNTDETTSDIIVSESGLYAVTITNNVTGCSNTDTESVTVDPIFPGQYFGQLSQCQGTSSIEIFVPLRSGIVYTFTGIGDPIVRSGFTGIWKVPLQSFNLENLTAGVHTFTITATQNDIQCAATLTGTFTVHPNPDPAPFVINYSCDPFMALLQAERPVSWYAVNDFISYGDQLISYTGGYYSTVVSNQYGCTAQSNQQVKGPPNVTILTGCYCIEPDLIQDGLAVIKAPFGSYSYWEWRVNGLAYQTCQAPPACNIVPNLTLTMDMLAHIPAGEDCVKITFYAESTYETGPLGKEIVCSDESGEFCWKIGPCEPVECETPVAKVYNIVCIEQSDGFSTYFIKWANESADEMVSPCPGNGVLPIVNADGVEIGSFLLLDYKLVNGVWAFEGTFKINAPHDLNNACWNIPFCVNSNGAQCGISKVCIPEGLPVVGCDSNPPCADNLTWEMTVDCENLPETPETHQITLHLNYNGEVIKGCNTYAVDIFSVTGQINPTITLTGIIADQNGDFDLTHTFGWQQFDSGDIICLGVNIRNNCGPICTQRFCYDASNLDCGPDNGLYIFDAQCREQREGGFLYDYTIEFRNESNIQSCEVRNSNPNGFNTITGIVSKNKIEGQYLSYRGDLNFVDEFNINNMTRYDVREVLPNCGDAGGNNDRETKQLSHQTQGNLSIVPNPASSQVMLNYNLPAAQGNSSCKIMIINSLGIQNAQIELANFARKGTVTFDVSSMENGVYQIYLLNEAQVLSVQRLVVLKN